VGAYAAPVPELEAEEGQEWRAARYGLAYNGERGSASI